ncbi:MAG: TetR/AcrR family transcriptional regulator [bacterium]|nr:TetR/AcrR family transcriptional regulator [bacterium]
MGVSDRKKRETEILRQRVLDVAEEIIAKEGVGNVTMRRIASSVEYAPTVLYRLFANKDDLMDHLIARGYVGVRQRYEETLSESSSDPLSALAGILRVYADYALAYPNHYRMWFATSDIRQKHDDLKMRHGRLEFVVFQTWFDCIEACREAGLFQGRSQMETFQTIWARMHGFISLRIQHPGFPWLPVDKHLDEVLDLKGAAEEKPLQ